jgi:EpsI family protein
MTTSRLSILLAVVLGGLGSVYLLPKVLGFMPLGIDLNLPDGLGEWWGQDAAVTQKERDVLGPGTEFARKQYTNGRGDVILASVVLSGEDMMTSIHRPERCLNAQGWQCVPTGTRFVEVPERGVLQVTRLKNRRTEQLPNGTIVAVDNICYYWFAGSSRLTASHTDRVLIDTVDRITGGYVQRWAMMMISATVTAGKSRFGRDEKAVDEMLTGFIRELAPRIHKDSVQYR